MRIINSDAALQAHPEFLNEQIDDHDKAIYAKGWNDCNKEYYNSIAELPVAPMACTDLSTRLRRAFEADELVNQRLLLDAADAIEELLEEKSKLENSGKLLVAAFDRLKEKVQKYRHAAFVISETCVDESKSHISPEDAIKKIREHIYYDNTESCSEPQKEGTE